MGSLTLPLQGRVAAAAAGRGLTQVGNMATQPRLGCLYAQTLGDRNYQLKTFILGGSEGQRVEYEKCTHYYPSRALITIIKGVILYQTPKQGSSLTQEISRFVVCRHTWASYRRLEKVPIANDTLGIDITRTQQHIMERDYFFCAEIARLSVQRLVPDRMRRDVRASADPQRAPVARSPIHLRARAAARSPATHRSRHHPAQELAPQVAHHDDRSLGK